MNTIFKQAVDKLLLGAELSDWDVKSEEELAQLYNMPLNEDVPPGNWVADEEDNSYDGVGFTDDVPEPAPGRRLAIGANGKLYMLVNDGMHGLFFRYTNKG